MDAYLQTFLQQFQHLRIQLEEIKSATDNFNSRNCIGVGGFGKVYKGEVSHYKGRSRVAIKRLGGDSNQGTAEFLKEITILSRYSHENLISLLGFCYQAKEMILVYELAYHGSLDRHLSSSHLTRTRRLKICLDVAKGLSYLHDPRETHQRLIHCDIKSGNILLDEQWNPKLSDLGLSIMGSANEQQSVVVTLAAGTGGYIDPQYMMTSTLTKESDVYSSGVVLFEILCGKLCYTYSNDTTQTKITWIESYKQKKLNEIIFKSSTIQPLDPGSLEIISDVAYQCLKEYREERPTMAEVVTQLETALQIQKISEMNPLFDYEEMSKSAEPSLSYESKSELLKLLFKGVLLNEGRTWFSLNKKGEHFEMISFAECLGSGPSDFENADNSRFAVGPYCYTRGDVIKARVKTQFLSPGVTYTVNLVVRLPSIEFEDSGIMEPRSHELISLKYRLEGETKTSVSYLAYKSDDGYCWMCELYQFTTDQRTVDLEILFEGFIKDYNEIKVEGIDFRPVEEVDHTGVKQPLSDSDANWEENLPTDYEEIIKRSKDTVHWTTKKEAYSILRKGFFIDDGQEWFSLDKYGKKCLMLSSTAAIKTFDRGSFRSLPESRFGEVFYVNRRIPDIYGLEESKLLSPETTYATYLIYKLPKDQSSFKVPVEVDDGESLSSGSFICLVSPETPVLRPKAHQKTYNPSNRPKIKGLPRPRDDGWMEVQLMEFRTAATNSSIPSVRSFMSRVALTGLIIQGIEYRPI